MRSVSSATCTSVFPVSVGLSPNRSVSSRLRSWVIAIGLVRLAGRLPAQLARLLDVQAHLLDQRLRRVEPALAPQPREEVDAELAAVQVLVGVEQVGLDEQRAP